MITISNLRPKNSFCSTFLDKKNFTVLFILYIKNQSLQNYSVFSSLHLLLLGFDSHFLHSVQMVSLNQWKVAQNVRCVERRLRRARREEREKERKSREREGCDIVRRGRANVNSSVWGLILIILLKCNS